MSALPPTRFPFSAVVGQEDAKLALLLAAVDPLIGGVLLRGDKGSAKTTLARGLAGLLAADAPFVDLPLGATEDRVVGTLDLAGVLGEGVTRLRPGLLGQVDGGVLYVDEINLLADHLVDTLLDVASSGVNIVERDGISHRHPARFVLVGSMNPEEGELRPQLLDRFGLCVEVRAPLDHSERVEAVRRRLRHDHAAAVPLAPGAGDDGAFSESEVTADAVLARRLVGVRPARLDDDVVAAASRLAVEVGAEGLRADLALCRAAAARAGLDGREAAGAEDLRRVAALVLVHRARRCPFDPPSLPPETLDSALESALGASPPGDTEAREEAPNHDGGDDEPGRDDQPESAQDAQPDQGGQDAPRARSTPMPVGAPRRPPLTDGPRAAAERGRILRDVPASEARGRPVAVVASVRELSRHRRTDPSAAFSEQHLRVAVQDAPAPRLLILTVDLSGSMGAPARASAATGTVVGLLSQAYQRRHQVALIGFRADGAQILLRPTSSVEVARNRLGDLATGGATPLAAGLRAALAMATRRPPSPAVPLVVVLTDGRATGAPGALEDALQAAGALRAAGVAALVLDCETGTPRLGLAARLAQAMGAECVAVDAVEPIALTGIIQRSTKGP